MSTARPPAGEIIDVRGSKGVIRPEHSHTLIRTDHLQVFRYALPAGKAIGTHTAAGLMVVQCLEGVVEFTAFGITRQLTANTMLWLPDHEPHALTARTDAVLLITIVLHRA